MKQRKKRMIMKKRKRKKMMKMGKLIKLKIKNK